MAWAPHCLNLLPVVYFVMLLFALVWNIIFLKKKKIPGTMHQH